MLAIHHDIHHDIHTHENTTIIHHSQEDIRFYHSIMIASILLISLQIFALIFLCYYYVTKKIRRENMTVIMGELEHNTE